jgi:hypothetical protein
MGSRTHRSSAVQGRGFGAAGRTGRSLARASLLAAAGALVLAVGAAGSTAGSARTITLNDSASLHKTSSHGFYLNETGRATGTVGGTLYLHLHIVSTNHVTAEVLIYPSGSSIAGSASGSYHVNGGTASFSGTMSVTHGTGSYNHASGSGLSFSGTIQRQTDAVTVHVNGRMSV